MALVLADRVQQTGTANTTVSFTLSGSVTGFQSFSVIGNTNTTYYGATDASGNWEVGLGTYSTTGPTLTRTTILSSSNSGSAVTFSGTVNVFVTYPSERSVYSNGTNIVPDNSAILLPASGGTGLSSFTANGIPYASSTSALATGSALSFDGTNFTTTGNATAKAFIPSNSTVPTNGLYLPASNTIGFSANSVARMVFNSSNEAIFGVGTTGVTNAVGTGFTIMDSNAAGVLNLYRYDTTVADTNGLGYIDFYSNGSGSISRAATIGAIATGTYTGSSTPSAITFSTCSTSSLTPSERVRISSAGLVGIGTAAPAYELDVQGTGDTTIRVKANTSSAGADDDANLILDAAETGESVVIFYTNTDTATNSSIYRQGGSFDLRFNTNGTVGMILDSSQNLQFNSGYGSVATAYGCRAWVNFDGTASGSFAGGTSTVTRVSGSTTATVTTTNSHGLITGNQVQALTGVAAGTYTITYISATQFSFTTVATTALTNASITFAVNSIKASGNVSSVVDVATGTSVINFSVSMPDANYAISGVSTMGSAGMVVGLDSSTAGAAPTLKTANAVRMQTLSTGGAAADPSNVSMAFFR